MTATIALIAGIAFVALGLYRLSPGAPRRLGPVAMGLALAAGAMAVASWRGAGDTRWLVAGLLLFLALPIATLASSSRSLRIAAVILGLLGTALMGMATISPRASATSAVPAGN